MLLCVQQLQNNNFIYKPINHFLKLISPLPSVYILICCIIESIISQNRASYESKENMI